MSARAASGVVLLADVGGTNTRVRLAGSDGPVTRFSNEGFDGVEAVLAAALSQLEPRPERAFLAVAAPVTGPRAMLTNRQWCVDAEALARRFGFSEVRLFNDLEAMAMALPRLGADDKVQVGPVRRGDPGAARAVVAPGTGLGVAGLVPCDGDWRPLPGEGGHVSLAAEGGEEWSVVREVLARHGHCSAERLLSGPGLGLLHALLHGMAPEQAPPPEAVSAAALAGGDPAARATVDCFLGWLGAFCGDVALTLGARGGLYLGGGLLPDLRPLVVRSALRERFERKGRFRAWLAEVPTWLIVHPEPVLLGLEALAAGPVGRR